LDPARTPVRYDARDGRVTKARTRRFSRAEYERLIEAGRVSSLGRRSRLIGGELHGRRAPGGRALHGDRKNREGADGSGSDPGGTVPHGGAHRASPTNSEPEARPSPVVPRNSGRLQAAPHPSRSVPHRRVGRVQPLPPIGKRKGSLYARAGLVGLRVLNLLDRVPEVYREARRPIQRRRFGWRLHSVAKCSGPPPGSRPLGGAGIEASRPSQASSPDGRRAQTGSSHSKPDRVVGLVPLQHLADPRLLVRAPSTISLIPLESATPDPVAVVLEAPLRESSSLQLVANPARSRRSSTGRVV